MKDREHENRQDQWRRLNTFLILLIFILLSGVGYLGYAEFKKISEEEKKNSEIAEIVKDEGYKRCSYKDTRDFETIGFGHLVKINEKFNDCLTPKEAVELLREDYAKAEESVNNNYKWAEKEVKLVLINMTYQLGINGVSKFKRTIECLKNKKYDCAASELLDSRWAYQTPHRAARLAGRIMSLD